MLLLSPSPNDTDGKMEGVGRRVGGGEGEVRERDL